MRAVIPKTSTLEIIVKARELFDADLNPENQEKIIDACTDLKTSDGTESGFGDENKYQTTYMYLDGDMVWSIKLNDKIGDKDYTLVLDDIVQKGSGYFTEITKKDGKIIGHVTSDGNYEGKEEDYSIKFHISLDSNDTDILTIDPKLQIRRPTPGE